MTDKEHPSLVSVAVGTVGDQFIRDEVTVKAVYRIKNFEIQVIASLKEELADEYIADCKNGLQELLRKRLNEDN